MIKFYEGPYHQHGAGFGGFFRGLMKIVRPVADVLKPVITSPITQKLAKEAVKTGIGIGSDMIKGKSFKTSASENLKKAKKRVADTVFESLRSMDEKEEEGGTASDEPPFKKQKPIKKKFYPKKVITSKYKTILD